MSKNLILHDLQLEHAETLASIHKVCFDAPWDLASFRHFFQESVYGHVFGWLANLEKVPVGFILCRTVSDSIEILTLGVMPNHQKKGIGTLLVNKLVETSNYPIFLEVSVANDGAIHIYEKLGFQKLAVRKNYYDQPNNTSLDAYLMKWDPKQNVEL